MCSLNMQKQRKKRIQVITGAGMAAHLPGMCAAIFPMLRSSVFRCIPLLLEEKIHCIQLYRCHPVFPVGDCSNQQWCKCRTSCSEDPCKHQIGTSDRLKAYSQELKEQVEAKDAQITGSRISGLLIKKVEE